MNARDVIAFSIFDLLNIVRGESPSARADAILSALDAAGYAVVLKEPTEEMLRNDVHKVISDLASLKEEVERISNTLYLVASRP